MEKKCCKCKRWLLLENFKSHAKRADGLQAQCIECQKEYRRQHYLTNRRKYIDKAAAWRDSFLEWWREFKQQFVCIRCGESHPACIQFHHPNDDKEGDVAELVATRNKERVLKEVAKCEPLCANCHFKEHYKKYYPALNDESSCNGG
jgi:hypothetical protein